MKKELVPISFVPAMPVVIVATKDNDVVNFATHGMYGQLANEPPLIYISVLKHHHTAKSILNTRTFSINFPSTKQIEKIKLCGSKSGADVDKSKVFEVFYGQSETPMVKECAVNLDCKVHDILDTKEMHIFIGEVLRIYCNEECLKENEIIAKTVDPLVCTLQGEFFNLGKEVK